MILPESKVLIIEDNLIYAKQLEHWIKPHVSEVNVTNSTERGTYFVSIEKPDIIFLDNVLPGINGIEVLEFFKELCPDSNLILMSSVFDLDEVMEALKFGADYVLDKKSEKEEVVIKLLKASISDETQEENRSVWNFFKRAKNESDESKIVAIIEDDEVFAYHLKWAINNLQSNNKNEVVSFTDLKTFEEFNKENKVDILFCDFHLPDGTAQDAVTLMQNNNAKSEIVVISRSLDFDKVINLNLEGVSEYILKDENWKIHFMDSMKKLNLVR